MNPGVVDWRHWVAFIYPGQSGDVGDTVPDSGSSGGKGQLALAHKSPPGDEGQASSHWAKNLVIRPENSH